ncbi:Sec7 domain-containing protein [Pararhizobium gei]|uniref:Sec7 domain-containing protein n=1 Tax=Pararhizobium gei TaxID=1395951 RepID=UPI0023DB91DC|nr:Sec7 domain-containing protein [Rhizobium gei]
METIPDEYDGDDEATIKEGVVLSFKLAGRLIAPDAVRDEFRLMRNQLKNPLTAEIAARICTKSGTHLLKLVSPRVDGDHAVLRFDRPDANHRAAMLPSTNAPDIPFCKVVYRPLEIIGHASLSVVEYIRNPDEHSEAVLRAFAEVFGADVLEAMRAVLQSPPQSPLKLGAGEFPIIFIPRPCGGDLQVTPVAPATAFMGMKRITDPYFQKKQENAPPPPRGRWTKQAVSAKPQNISGAIGGPRVRFLATMPAGMSREESELYRYVQGGRFPRWRDQEAAKWVLGYADRLDADAVYNNSNTRAALDRAAERLIREAEAFISDMVYDASHLAGRHGLAEGKRQSPPDPASVLMQLRWGSEDDRERARKTLTSPHFEHMLRQSVGGTS